LPLLQQAQIPVAVNPDTRLRQLATDRGWRILQLFS
jgi:phosphoserine phosphatase